MALPYCKLSDAAYDRGTGSIELHHVLTASSLIERRRGYPLYTPRQQRVFNQSPIASSYERYGYYILDRPPRAIHEVRMGKDDVLASDEYTVFGRMVRLGDYAKVGYPMRITANWGDGRRTPNTVAYTASHDSGLIATLDSAAPSWLTPGALVELVSHRTDADDADNDIRTSEVRYVVTVDDTAVTLNDTVDDTEDGKENMVTEVTALAELQTACIGITRRVAYNLAANDPSKMDGDTLVKGYEWLLTESNAEHGV